MAIDRATGIVLVVGENMLDLFISEITDDTAVTNDAEETVVDGAFTEEEDFDEYYDENGLSINIENFSGPLDLLL